MPGIRTARSVGRRRRALQPEQLEAERHRQDARPDACVLLPAAIASSRAFSEGFRLFIQVRAKGISTHCLTGQQTLPEIRVPTELPPTVFSDQELVQRTRESRDAFALLVERYYRMAYAIALARVKSPEVAEEVVQETFLRAWLNLDGLRRPEQLSTWLGSIARNLAENWRVTDQTRSHLAAMVPLSEEAVAMPDDRLRGVRDELVSATESARCQRGESPLAGRLP